MPAIASDGDAIGDDAVIAVDLGGRDGDIADVRMRSDVQPHRTMQARIVEEVVEVLLQEPAVLKLLHEAGRDGVPVQLVC
jgi:hypothetical protein